MTAWWERGFSVTRWLADVRDAGVDVAWDGFSTSLVPRFGYVPPWVCSDHYQLARAGVLRAHFEAA